MSEMPLHQKYKDANPVAVLVVSNFGSLAILDLTAEECVAAWHFGEGYQKIRRHQIFYSKGGRAYINKNNRRYYIDEFMRV